MWNVIIVKAAKKDLRYLKQSRLLDRLKEIVDVLKENPFQPPYEKLVGNFAGFYTRRINIQHRLVYSVDATPFTSGGDAFQGTVKIFACYQRYHH